MITVLTIFVVLIFLLLVVFGVAGYLAWQKLSVFITYNTKYDSVAYQQAVAATGKFPKSSLSAQKSEQRGRRVQQVPELVDITELDFETAYSAVSEAGL